MAVIVRGASTNHGLEVTEKGAAQVALPASAQDEDGGFVKLAAQSDNGDVTGTPVVREVYENDDYDNSWYGVDENENPLPEDTYFYILKPENSITIKGYVVIAR